MNKHAAPLLIGTFLAVLCICVTAARFEDLVVSKLTVQNNLIGTPVSQTVTNGQSITIKSLVTHISPSATATCTLATVTSGTIAILRNTGSYSMVFNDDNGTLNLGSSSRTIGTNDTWMGVAGSTGWREISFMDN